MKHEHLNTQELRDKLNSMNSQNSVSDDRLINIFRLIKIHLEYNELTKNFPKLYFFCNWLHHPSMDRGEAQALLIQISLAISDRWQNTDEVIQAFSSQLKSVSFINELHFLFDILNLNHPIKLNSNELWKFIINHILTNPIKIPDTKIFDKNGTFDTKKAAKSFRLKAIPHVFCYYIAASKTENGKPAEYIFDIRVHIVGWTTGKENFINLIIPIV